MKKQILITFSSLVLFSCNKQTPATQSATSTTVTTANVSFNAYIKPNILPKCTSCHGSSGGVSYSGTYANLFAQKSSFNSVIQSGSMPQGSPLADADKILVKAWIDRGAPEN